MNANLLGLIPPLPLAGLVLNGTPGRKLPRSGVSAPLFVIPKGNPRLNPATIAPASSHTA